MADAPLSIIVDDQRADLIALSGPNQWTNSSEPEWFNGTTQSPIYALNNSGLFGTLQMKFQGTSVAFFGVTPPPFADSQTLTVSIDGNTPYNTSYSDPNPQSYRQWYQSPTLQDGPHVISLSHIAGTTLDYAVVTAGTSTSLDNEHIIVDNDDPGVTFNGTWRRSQYMFNSGPQPDGFPYHNTTHQATTAGNSFTYRFAGRSAAIYGIFSWANIGVLELNFTLDGASLSQTFRVNPDTPQFVSELGQQQNFLFYSYDFLQPGDHTLIVSVTESINQTFEFDYITYKPSFSSLGSMPDLSQNTTSTAGNSGDTPAKKHVFLMIAAIAGALLIVILLGMLGLYLRRRKNVKGKYEPVYPFVPLQRPEVTVTRGLLSQNTPPTTASMYSDSFDAAQGVSTPQHDLSTPPSNHEHFDPTTLISQNTVQPPNAASNHDPTGERNSGLTSMYTEASPPSYYETTRGQPPTTITYVISRQEQG